ncbi:hypothetical protein C8Q77DRAFT_911380 [Trametes polyzona]|nr:hypothetical protein C8Q77DRAFT_911380 [Trametes polyzona]
MNEALSSSSIFASPQSGWYPLPGYAASTILLDPTLVGLEREDSRLRRVAILTPQTRPEQGRAAYRHIASGATRTTHPCHPSLPAPFSRSATLQLLMPTAPARPPRSALIRPGPPRDRRGWRRDSRLRGGHRPRGGRHAIPEGPEHNHCKTVSRYARQVALHGARTHALAHSRTRVPAAHSPGECALGLAALVREAARLL